MKTVSIITLTNHPYFTVQKAAPSHVKEKKRNRERTAIKGRWTSGGKRPTFLLICISLPLEKKKTARLGRDRILY